MARPRVRLITDCGHPTAPEVLRQCWPRRATRTQRDLARLQILWPGLKIFLLRTAAHVGGEIEDPCHTRPLLASAILEATHAAWNELDESGNGGRSLVAFVDAMSDRVLDVLSYRISVSDAVWRPLRQPFLAWRREHSGMLMVRKCQIRRAGHIADAFRAKLVADTGIRQFLEAQPSVP